MPMELGGMARERRFSADGEICLVPMRTIEQEAVLRRYPRQDLISTAVKRRAANPTGDNRTLARTSRNCSD
jgi:hypothetical protein